MNRRDAMKLAAGLAVSFVVPAPRKRIDLMRFCGRREFSRFDVRLPYTFDDWTYATDARVCVRVRPESADRFDHEGKPPPFDSLSWNHDKLQTRWATLPARDPMLARGSCCPACDGSGFEGGAIGTDCPRCDWLGHCTSCFDGVIPPPGVGVCRVCGGKAIGVFPSVVDLDGRHFDAGLYSKVLALEPEYVHDNWNSMASYPLLKFRFDGGHGLLMGLNPSSVRPNLVA